MVTLNLEVKSIGNTYLSLYTTDREELTIPRRICSLRA
jgi:hypothetical protein